MEGVARRVMGATRGVERHKTRVLLSVLCCFHAKQTSESTHPDTYAFSAATGAANAAGLGGLEGLSSTSGSSEKPCICATTPRHNAALLLAK